VVAETLRRKTLSRAGDTRLVTRGHADGDEAEKEKLDQSIHGINSRCNKIW